MAWHFQAAFSILGGKFPSQNAALCIVIRTQQTKTSSAPSHLQWLCKLICRKNVIVLCCTDTQRMFKKIILYRVRFKWGNQTSWTKQRITVGMLTGVSVARVLGIALSIHSLNYQHSQLLQSSWFMVLHERSSTCTIPCYSLSHCYSCMWKDNVTRPFLVCSFCWLFTGIFIYIKFGQLCSRSCLGESVRLPDSPPRMLINTLKHIKCIY